MQITNIILALQACTNLLDRVNQSICRQVPVDPHWTLDQYIYSISRHLHWFSVNTWSTSRLTVSQQLTNFWQTRHQVSIHSANYLPTVIQVSIECQSYIDEVSIWGVDWMLTKLPIKGHDQHSTIWSTCNLFVLKNYWFTCVCLFQSAFKIVCKLFTMYPGMSC